MDYAGPLYVKSSTGDRSSTKVYIALFTCAVVRAVHLKVAEDLSSESFIRIPWWGGFYERLVGSGKRCLKKSFGRSLLSLPDIVTMVTEVEAVLNSRPLTYLYPDIEDNPPLTPAHFLCG